MQNDFVDVSQFTPNWNPRSTGSNKEGNRQDLQPTEKSWIVGWYLGSRQVEINNKNYTVHKILANRVGNPDHLAEPLPEGGQKEYEFFGTGVLNSQLAEHVQPGQYVQITWLGMTAPKKAGGSNYHNWKVGVSQQTEPIQVQGGIPVGYGGNSADQASGEANKPQYDPNVDAGGNPDPAQANAGNATPGDAAQNFVAEGDDDLPF